MTPPSSSPTSTFSQYQQNIQRQTKEQKAVGNLLSGMAIGLIASILIVAILASFGGWVLYRQIQHQSVTVAQLNDKFTASVQTLREDLKKTSTSLEQSETIIQAQKQQINSLQNQVEDVRGQAKKDNIADQARLTKIEKRISDLERERIR